MIHVLTLTQPKATKNYKGESGKCAKSDYVIEGGVSYGHKITARAVTPLWHAIGGQCIVVWEGPSGESPLFDPSLSKEIL